MLRRIAFFQRLPRVRWVDAPDEPFIPLETRSKYPELEPDFAVLDQDLLPMFRELDKAALQRQNQFRLAQVVLIFGGVIATLLGAVQAALGSEVWPGIVEALVGALLSGFAFWESSLHPREKYLSDRVAAESLRGEYFLFLGHVHPYGTADLQQRKARLIERVADAYQSADAPVS